jgi:hypothetical protein
MPISAGFLTGTTKAAAFRALINAGFRTDSDVVSRKPKKLD